MLNRLLLRSVMCLGFAWITALSLQGQLVPQNGPNQGNLFENAGKGDSTNQQSVTSLGGAAQADFDTLIELIQTTVAPNSWEDVGGSGSIQGFPGGVYVNAKGVMQKVDARILNGLQRAQVAANLAHSKASSNLSIDKDVLKPSELRKVSLKKLQAYLQGVAIEGKHPIDATKYLAGMSRIDYLLLDEETNDIIIAGPAGEWMTDRNGRIVNSSNRRPVIHLDDLVVLLRNTFRGVGEFTCSITPSQENLKNAQDYITRTTQQPLKMGERDDWLNGLRDSVGNQAIEVMAIPAGSRLARIIVEADYHMKLVGIGLEPGTDGVVSYLESMEFDKGEVPPPMGVLRWWFTLNDSSISTNEHRNVFELKQQAVQVLSEDELLTKQGKRVHTGTTERLNRAYAASFTKHFNALASRYPIYAELENIFELALVSSILKHDDIPDRFDWPIDFFLNPDGYEVEMRRVPKEVPTVINHRVFNRKHVVAAVSGGVRVSGKTWLTSHTSNKDFNADQFLAQQQKDEDSWWWD